MSKLEAAVNWLFLRGSPLSSIVRIALLVALVPVLLAIPFIGRNTEHHYASGSTSASSRPVAASEDPLFLQSSATLPARPLFPYSVIPGGAYSAQELENAIEHDPLVAHHYADFDLAKVHIVRLDQDRMEYVSYRLGDRIFWTNRELRLHKGEEVITDGTHLARTRCGNRLSDHAVGPTSAAQPSPEVLESPATAERTPELLAGNYLPNEIPQVGAPLLPSFPGGPTGTIIPPAYFPIVGNGIPSGSSSPGGPTGGGPPGGGPPGGGPPGGGPPGGGPPGGGPPGGGPPGGGPPGGGPPGGGPPGGGPPGGGPPGGGPPGGGPPGGGPPGGGPPGGGPPINTPEPSSLLLLAGGLGSLWAYARRKKRSA